MIDKENIDQLLDWYRIKRKYLLGLIISIIGTHILVVGVITVFYLFPGQTIYHYDVIIYNGPLIKFYMEITLVVIGGLLLLIGLPLLIKSTIKKKNL